MAHSYRIDRIDLHWGQVPVDLVFSYGAVATFSFTIVRLGSADGEGIGEVLVEPNEFARSFLPSLLGADSRRLDALLPATQSDYDRIFCEAVSIALYDLVGRVSSLPLYALLGGKKRDVLPLMPCIFPTDAQDAGAKARRFFDLGHTFLKLKLIGDLAEDVARVAAVRSVAPAGAVLQGDANCGYKTVPEARDAVRQIGDAGLDIFEDPLAGGVDEYLSLRGAGGAKVMVDALSRRTDDLVDVLRRGAADVIGIHPDQPGSMSKAMHHVRLAESFGVPVVIGGTGYVGVGSAAYQHLTAAATAEGPCGELGGAFDHGMPHGVVKRPLPMAGGSLTLPDTPGMGVDLDPDALADLQVGHQSWPDR